MRIIVAIITLLLLGCKDPEAEMDTCNNSFLDPGEVDVDCGGPCDACEEKFVESMSFQMTADPEAETPPAYAMIEYSISQEGDYLILSGTDYQRTINLFFKSDGSTGIYQLDSLSNLNINGQFYFGYKDHEISIFENNTDAKRISGYFSSTFFKTTADDTLYVTGGTYADIPYSF